MLKQVKVQFLSRFDPRAFLLSFLIKNASLVLTTLWENECELKGYSIQGSCGISTKVNKIGRLWDIRKV